MKITDLMMLAEASTGYVGGPAIDTLPHLSLVEAAMELPAEIASMRIDLMESNIAQNNIMVEAAVSAIQYGSQIDVDTLMENAFDTLKSKVIAFFQKLKKWIDSIIAKIALTINKVRMSGKQLWDRYKNDPGLRDKTWEDLTMKGYAFKNNVTFKDDLTDVDGFMASAVAELEKIGDIQLKDAKEIAEKIEDVSSDDAKEAFLEQLLGFQVTAGTWQSDAQKELYGEKTELRYGSDGFDIGTVSNILNGSDNLDKIKSSYEKFKKAISDSEKKMQKDLGNYQKDTGPKKAGEVTTDDNAAVIKYYNKYISMYQLASECITGVKGLRVKYETDRVNQAKTALVKMIGWKKPKNQNNSFELEMDMLDFDL